MVEARREIARMRRAEQPLTFVFVDVDGLKMVNDERGHVAGDTLLRMVAQQIRTRLRNYDLLVRYGGDEFVCLLSNTNARDAQARFDSVSAALAGGPHPSSVSVGMSELRKADTAETVLARADAAMYRGREDRGRHGR
jgi:diguanylate cyclase (GGDEF)-like protein